MSEYVVLDNDSFVIVELGNMLSTTLVLAEVVDDSGDDPLISLKDPYASPSDFLWPDNMFYNETIRLSEWKRKSLSLTYPLRQPPDRLP